MTLDPTDQKLLAALQADAQLTAQDLGERLNLSASQAGRRRQRLEAEGYIDGYRAKLSAPRLGLAVQAFVQVQMATHIKRRCADLELRIVARANSIPGIDDSAVIDGYPHTDRENLKAPAVALPSNLARLTEGSRRKRHNHSAGAAIPTSAEAPRPTSTRPADPGRKKSRLDLDNSSGVDDRAGDNSVEE